ncbi:MAG: NifB/NifX family molybdenum-iron cluster-binding protein [bacterium]|nr:NifB/NifX family molybdenum-iron cluster-binding protein [bacterium]
MNILIPVTENKGLQSPVHAHFGSAPVFLIVDTDNGNCRAVSNQNLHHEHGMCRPLQAFAGEKVDGVVVGGIGMGALNQLQAANLRVYLAEAPTVRETLDQLKSGSLREVTPANACRHHGQGGTCGH